MAHQNSPMMVAAQQSLAADGAIACFSSNLFPLSLNADRAPQLKAVVMRLIGIVKKKLTPASKSYLVAAVYVLIPLVLGLAAYWRQRDWFSSDNPNYVWRVSYCFLTGFWGLAMRAYERRDKLWVKDGNDRVPWDYFLLYPLGLIMNACAVFTVLMLYADKLHGLFWTAAVPLGMILGRYAHPGESKLTKLLDKAVDKIKDH